MPVTISLLLELASVSLAVAAPVPCAKLPNEAVPAARHARTDADWTQWDPNLAKALKSLWHRSVMALSHDAKGVKGVARRPAAAGPFDAAAWDLSDATFVTFNVPMVPAGEGGNAATRTERYVGYWSKGKLARIDDACFQSMEPTHLDVAKGVAYGKPIAGECNTVSCPLPTAKP